MNKVTIGSATLYLADCREILTDLRQVDALITDPPYGVSLGSHLAAKDRRTDRVLVKDGYDGYDDSAENYLTVVVPAIKKALEITRTVADSFLAFRRQSGNCRLRRQ